MEHTNPPTTVAGSSSGQLVAAASSPPSPVNGLDSILDTNLTEAELAELHQCTDEQLAGLIPMEQHMIRRAGDEGSNALQQMHAGKLDHLIDRYLANEDLTEVQMANVRLGMDLQALVDRKFVIMRKSFKKIETMQKILDERIEALQKILDEGTVAERMAVEDDEGSEDVIQTVVRKPL